MNYCKIANVATPQNILYVHFIISLFHLIWLFYPLDNTFDIQPGQQSLNFRKLNFIPRPCLLLWLSASLRTSFRTTLEQAMLHYLNLPATLHCCFYTDRIHHYYINHCAEQLSSLIMTPRDCGASSGLQRGTSPTLIHDPWPWSVSTPSIRLEKSRLQKRCFSQNSTLMNNWTL